MKIIQILFLSFIFFFLAPLYGASEFESLFELGQKSYEEFNIDEAISALEKATSLQFEEDFNQYKDVASAHFLLGVSYISKDDLTKARTAFQKVLEIDPDFEIDKSVFSPKIVLAFRGVQTELFKSQFLLSIMSEPLFAKVYLDEEEVGVTPLTLDLPRKKHKVKIELEGHELWKKTIEPTQYKMKLNANLTKIVKQKEEEFKKEVFGKKVENFGFKNSGGETQEVNLLSSFLETEKEEKLWYQNKWVVGGVALAALGVIAILASQNKEANPTVPLARGVRINVP